MAVRASSFACHARFTGLLPSRGCFQPLQLQKLSALAPPSTAKLHARHSDQLNSEPVEIVSPYPSLSTSSPSYEKKAAPHEAGLSVLRRHLVLGSTGLLITAVAGGDANRTAQAAVAASGDNLVQPPASVLVIGAGGATGGRIVRELLKRGYKVKAGARSVESAKAKLGSADGLTFVRVDVTESESAIEEAIGDAEAVIVATGKASLNPGDSWSVDNLGTQKAVDAAKKKGVKKFVLISSILTNGAAIGQFFNPAYLVLNIIGGGVLFAKLKAEQHIKTAGVDYTVVRPGGLSNEPPRGNVKMGAEDTLYEGSISRDLVALTAVEALVSRNASNKIVEVVESADAPTKPFDELFAAS